MKQNLFLKGVAVLVMLATGIATGEGKNLPAKFDDKLEDVSNQGSGISDSFLNPHDPDDLVHHYTTEEIDEYRWISMDHDGIETTATDREVIAILEKVRRNNSTNLISEPYFPANHNREKVPKKRTIIGTDGRYRHSSYGNPYCAIGRMEHGNCTAFLVGPYHAITARHCVYDCIRNQWKSRRGIYLQHNCYSGGILMREVRTWTYHKNNCNNNDKNRDIAWILLDKNRYNSSCWMGYGSWEPMPIVTGEVCGYPSDKPTQSYKCLYCSRCGDVRQASGWRLQYTCDTNDGMTGGPVFTGDYDSKEHQYAFGVHTHGYTGINQATQFTQYYHKWTNQWKCTHGGYNCD